jgi:hypothetical protein
LLLGAILATAGGVLTDLWRQRRSRRAAERLIYHELLLNYGALLGVRMGDADPQVLSARLTDAAWKAHSETLALAGEFENFQKLWGTYQIVSRLSSGHHGKELPKELLDAALDAMEDRLGAVGIKAGVPRRTLAENRRIRLMADLPKGDRASVWSEYVREGSLTNDPEAWLRERVARTAARRSIGAA